MNLIFPVTLAVRTAACHGVQDWAASNILLNQPTRQFWKKFGWVLVETMSKKGLVPADYQYPLTLL